MIDGTTIRVKQGADHVLVYRQRLRGANGTKLPYPVEDGTTYELQVKAGNWADADVLAEYDAVVLDADEGDIQLSLAHAETAAIDVGRYVYNLARMTSAGNLKIVRSGPWVLEWGLADD